MTTICEQFGQISLAACGDCLIGNGPASTMLRNFGLAVALENRSLVVASESDAAAMSAALLAMSSWWPKAPDGATIWNITATLFAALIAAGAAILAARWAARSTMKSARELQDRERNLERQSVAALLSADLHRKLVMLALMLQEPEGAQVHELATMDANTKVILEASLPKLGALGHQGAAQLLAAFDGLSLLAHDAHGGGQATQDLTERMRTVAIHIGCILDTLWERYELERPKRLEEAGIDLKAVGLDQLKNLGL